VHLGGLLIDSFMPFGLPDLLVPLRAEYRPVATAVGVISMYAMVVVMTSSWTKRRIGITWWRRLHMLAIPTFTLSMLHGIFAGSDAARPWMWAIYVVTGAIVFFLVLVRGLTFGHRPERAPRPERAEPVRGPAQPASM
jgi:DMSO/TMAO reductase YedYZ heme-binding membrane subunit